MNMNDFIRVGVISSTHGIRGEVKVFPTTDDVNRFKNLKKVFLDTQKDQLELEIEGVKFFKQFVILKFKGIDNINDVEKYKGNDILINRKDAVTLKENEYFIFELIGCTVVTDEGQELGILSEVLSTGANDVYVVTTADKKEILLPYTEECILNIDIENKKIKAHIIPGLLD